MNESEVTDHMRLQNNSLFTIGYERGCRGGRELYLNPSWWVLKQNLDGKTCDSCCQGTGWSEEHTMGPSTKGDTMVGPKLATPNDELRLVKDWLTLMICLLASKVDKWLQKTNTRANICTQNAPTLHKCRRARTRARARAHTHTKGTNLYLRRLLMIMCVRVQ